MHTLVCNHERMQTARVRIRGMAKPLKVDKAAFDAVLRKLAHSAPVKKSEVKTEKTKPAKIIKPSRSR